MSKAILLADDSVTIQKVIELFFMDQDYQIEAVSSGDEALRKLDAGVPDLVIADVHMPGASGFDVARRVKELSPRTPVLLLVGTFEPFDEADFAASGADEVLKKPFDSQVLLPLVEKLLPPGGEAPVSEVAEAAPPASEIEDAGVFSLDDDAFGTASEVAPPPELAAAEGPPSAGLAWEEPEEPAAPVDEAEPSPAGFALGEPALEGAFPAETAAPEPEAQVSEPAEMAEAFGGEAPPPETPWGAPAETTAVDTDAPEEPTPAATPEPAPEADEVPAVSDGQPAAGLSDEDVERIAVRVAELVGEKVSREIAWEVIPDLAEVVIKERLRELESQIE